MIPEYILGHWGWADILQSSVESLNPRNWNIISTIHKNIFLLLCHDVGSWARSSVCETVLQYFTQILHSHDLIITLKLIFMTTVSGIYNWVHLMTAMLTTVGSDLVYYISLNKRARCRGRWRALYPVHVYLGRCIYSVKYGNIWNILGKGINQYYILLH